MDVVIEKLNFYSFKSNKFNYKWLHVASGYHIRQHRFRFSEKQLNSIYQEFKSINVRILKDIYLFISTLGSQ